MQEFPRIKSFIFCFTIQILFFRAKLFVLDQVEIILLSGFSRFMEIKEKYVNVYSRITGMRGYCDISVDKTLQTT